MSTGVDFTWVGSPAYTPPAGPSYDFTWAGGDPPDPDPVILKGWNGTAFVPGVLKKWDGSVYVVYPLKYYNGTSWLSV